MNAFERFSYYAAQYLDDMKHSNKSAQTARNYDKAIRMFKQYWEEHGNKDEAPRTDLFREWRNDMDMRGLKPSTIRQYLMALHIFYSYYADEEDSEGNLVFDGRNPVSTKLYPQQEKKPYDVILTDDQVSALWANERPKGYSAEQWVRNYAIITLLLDSKIRNSECLDLKMKDVDFDEKVLFVQRGKGRKFRCVDLTDASIVALQLYLKYGNRPKAMSENDYLFGTYADSSGRGNTGSWHRGTNQWLSSVVERTVFKVTGIHDVRTHDLRHIGARLELQNGVSKEQLQHELGHSSVTTTEIYSGNLEAKMGRKSARKVFEARDLWVERNRKLLEETP